MIQFENVTKSFWVKGTQKIVIDDLNLTLPTGKSLALLGRNGAGKSTLLQMISGVQPCDTGGIYSDGSISWPVGFKGAVHGDMTGAQNTKFVARIYGVDTEELVVFTQDFAELGDHFHLPVRTYSAGMRARLGFGLSMGIKFDTYLVDEATAVGDKRFNIKSRAVFRDRMKNSSSIVVSHQMMTVRRFCDAGLLLNDGQVKYYEDLEEAIEQHEELNGI